MNVNNTHYPLFFTVAQVRFSRKGKVEKNSCASGFFYRFENKLYFITNRHVVIDETDKTDVHHPDELRLELHVDRNNLDRKAPPYKIPLYEGKNKQKWIEHPQNKNISDPRKMIDVVAITIDEKELCEKGYYVESFSSHGYYAIDNLSSWDNLIVIGYPDGYYDSKHNLPLIRRANLASAPSIPFNKEPKLLIDAQLHKGTSGSPVLKPTGYPLTSLEDGDVIMPEDELDVARDYISRSLVGIHSGEFEGNKPELGLHNVWLAGLIPDIITQKSYYFDRIGCELED